MNGLLIYATKYGSCQEISEMVAKPLNIECVNVQSNPDCAKYDYIIFASCLYAGQMDKYLKEYIAQNESILLTKKVFMFNSGLTKDNKFIDETYTNNLSASMNQHLITKVCLGGRLNFPKMGFFEKSIIKMLNKRSSFVSKEQFKENVDMIDHEAISSFIETIQNNLKK